MKRKQIGRNMKIILNKISRIRLRGNWLKMAIMAHRSVQSQLEKKMSKIFGICPNVLWYLGYLKQEKTITCYSYLFWTNKFDLKFWMSNFIYLKPRVKRVALNKEIWHEKFLDLVYLFKKVGIFCFYSWKFNTKRTQTPYFS